MAARWARWALIYTFVPRGCAGGFWGGGEKKKKHAHAAGKMPGAFVSSSRYEQLSYREGGSRVECFLWGERVDEMVKEECHAGPPFWGWWNEFRNCAVTNACLHRNVLTLYSGRASPPPFIVQNGGNEPATAAQEPRAQGLPEPAGLQ